MFQLHPTSPAVVRLLLLSLAIILTDTSKKEFDEAYYIHLGAGYSYSYLETPSTNKSFLCSSVLQCSIIALNSQSEIFAYNKDSRLCKNYLVSDMTVKHVQDNKEMAFYRYSEWIKVYSVSKNAGSKVYNSFMNKGSPSTWNVNKCMGSFCPNFYRSPLLDIWSDLQIDEVKLVIYKNQTAVKNILFDGRNTSLTSWFSYKNLKSSPWNDLNSRRPTYFAIDGFKQKRQFYIANHNGCSGDNGWLLINDETFACPYEKVQHYPMIRYSNRDSKVWWSREHGLADSFAIFIRLRKKYPIT